MKLNGVNNDKVNVTNSLKFKGKPVLSDSGVPYYKSNSGKAIASIPASFFALTSIAAFVMNKKFESGDKEFMKKMKENDAKKFTKLANDKSVKKVGLLIMLTAGLQFACGAIVDAIRNKKSKDTAEKLLQPGRDLNQSNLNFSDNGMPYRASDTGAKAGALLGLGYTAAIFLATKALKIKGDASIFRTASILFTNVGLGALLGLWADRAANKNAGKRL